MDENEDLKNLVRESLAKDEERKPKPQRNEFSEKRRAFFNKYKIYNNPKMKYVKTALASLAVVMFVCISFLAFKIGKPIIGFILDANEIKQNINIDDFKLNSNIHIYDNNDKEILTANQEKNVEYLPYEKVPKDVFNAFISVEDIRFYKHNGVDLKALVRAGISLFKNNGTITQGGSTITQQLVKLTYLSTEQSIERKVKEIVIAKELEKQFSKEQILEFYVNNIYFGNNAYGINSASLEYFGVTVDKLSLAQICYLSSIPNNPTIYDPYTKDETGENQKLKDRQSLFLRKMLECEFITEEQYNQAVNEKIVLKHSNDISKYDARTNTVLTEVAEIIMQTDGFELKYKFNSNDERKVYTQEYNEAKKAALAKLYKKGYSIYTSLDEDIQKSTQEAIDKGLVSNTEKTSEGIYALQGSAIVLDNETGLIKAMVNGRSSDVTDYNNRVTESKRQNASTMKPIAIYAPSIENKGLLPSTKVLDKKQSDDEPKNVDIYRGEISARDALTYSSNVVAHNLYKELTPKVGLNYLYNMEFTSIVDEDFTLASGLGGLTVGTNVKEMAGAYSTLANKGRFNRPSVVREIKDKYGDTIYVHSKTNTEIYQPATAVITTDMLKSVVESGTGRPAKFNPTIETAGKTGTADDRKDLWFAGYTPKYTSVVWVGYDNPKSIVGVNTASIWANIMRPIHNGLNNLKFDEGNNLVKHARIDSEGKELPKDSKDGRYEIFPIDYKLEPSTQKNEDSLRSELILRLENNMKAPNEHPTDRIVINTAIKNLDLIESEINRLDISDELRKTLRGLINYDREQLKLRLDKLNNSDKETNISSSTNGETTTEHINKGD